jgi:regulator of sirC expression with transglutaminase-like and TPR domain
LTLDFFKDIGNQFEKLSEVPDESVDMVNGALLIARTTYRDLDEAFYRQYLAGLADRYRSSLNRIDPPMEMIAKLNRIIFEEEGFRGNSRDYFNPDNSFLNRVIDRRLGIPITLSLIYIEVGRSAGLDFQGIALPGHFIAALFYKSDRILLDPFNKAKILSEKDCQRIVGPRLDHNNFDALLTLTLAKPKEILIRMLRNLKAIYLHSNNELKTFEMLHWILSLKPDAVKERLERGLRYEAMGNSGRAIEDFQRYLELSPGMEDDYEIQSKIENLKKQNTWMH